MMKRSLSAILAGSLLMYIAQAEAQQEPATQRWWYPAAPASAPAQPAVRSAPVRNNPWDTREPARTRRGTSHKSGGGGMGMGSGSRSKPRRTIRPSQPPRTPYRQQQVERKPPLPPRVEVSVNETNPYEQQSLVYIVRILSSGNLRSVSPELPEADSVVVRQLGDPVNSSKDEGGRRLFTTEYRYLLMPLATGRIEIPPAVVNGVMASASGGNGPPVEIVAKQPVFLDVQPAVAAVQPWLPLYRLQIDARILDKEELVAGDPVRLEVEVSAIGATGAQLPSIAAQLDSPDFRIYPGKSFTEGKLSEDGSELRGRRVETFTLVPQYGGWLKIPNISLNWWNVRYRRPEVASLLMDRLEVEGPQGPVRLPGGGREGGGVFGDAGMLVWLPMLIAVGILLYGWVNAFVGPGRMPGSGRVLGFTRSLLGDLYAPLAAFGARVSPRRHFHRLRAWIGRNLPVSWKLWFCLRAVAREDDPEEWGHALQILAAKHLGVRPQAHLKELGKSIAACHPRANERQVDQLMDELNEAIYGDHPIRSFDRWKREFERQIKPGLFPLRLRGCKVARSRPLRTLPELNPRHGGRQAA